MIRIILVVFVILSFTLGKMCCESIISDDTGYAGIDDGLHKSDVLKSYLLQLDKYVAIAGRPRFVS